MVDGVAVKRLCEDVEEPPALLVLVDDSDDLIVKPAFDPLCLCGKRRYHIGRCKVKEARRKAEKFADDVAGSHRGASGWQTAVLVSGRLFLPANRDDPEYLAECLGLRLDQVTIWADRLKANEIWVDGKVAISSDRPEEFYVELILYSLVADGQVVRVGGCAK